MAYRGVWLIFSLSVFFCCGLLANGREIKLDLKINDGLPISTIMIGSNQYQLMLGTWYSDIWIFSKSACSTKNLKAKQPAKVLEANVAMCKKVKKYDDTSLSDSDKMKEFEIPYFQGKLKGYLIKETITIGGHKLQQQSIGIVTDWPLEMTNNNKKGCFDGHFGLMFLQKKEGIEESLFFKSLLEQNLISRKHFGLYFNPNHRSGELILGGIDNKRMAGGEESLKDVQIVSAKTGWLINIDSIKVGNVEVATNIKAYVDLGSNAFFGKQEIITNINRAIGVEIDFPRTDSQTGKQTQEDLFRIANCRMDKTIEMTINENKFTLDESDIVLHAYNKFCVSTFTIKDSDMDYDLILGTRFLNKYYSVFDVEGKRIRFAAIRNGEKEGSNQG